MKLRELRHGRDNIGPSWPPQFSGGYEGAEKFPVGEVGTLTRVAPAKLVRGVHVHIKYEGRQWSGMMQWNGEQPSVEKVIETLTRHVGEDLRGLGNVDLD